MSRARWRMVATGCAAAFAGSTVTDAGAPTARPDDARLHRAPTTGFRLEENRGQSDAGVDFVARCRGYMAWVRPTDVVLGLAGPESSLDVIDLRLVGAQVRRAATSDPLPGVSNYLIGRDESKWVRGAPSFGRARYADAWPGVGVTYFGDDRRLQFDFDVAPGADAGAVDLAFDGATSVRVADDGSLRVAAPQGELVVSAPVAYESIGAARRLLVARWTARGGVRAGFEVAGRDPSRTLVVDPSVAYATYFGGSSLDLDGGLAVDASFNAYVSGHTSSADLPTTAGAYQTTKAGAGYDAYCAKFNASGSVLAYSTYVGGTSDETAVALAVDGAGSAYLYGLTSSTDFPTTSGAAEPTKTGSGNVGFVVKLNPGGTARSYATYVNANNLAAGIAVDSSGDAYVLARTASTGVTRLYELVPSGASYAQTYTFDTTNEFPYAIALDPNRYAYVTGATGSATFPVTSGAAQSTYGGGSFDAFVLKLSPTFAVTYATYLGGSAVERGVGIAADLAGNAYVVGYTTSPDFPTANAVQSTKGGGQDAFVARLNASGTALGFSTYLGGAGDEFGYSVAVASGTSAVYVAGETPSTDFPTTPGAVQTTKAGAAGVSDSFLTALRTNGTLQYSTYYGGSAVDRAICVATDSAGDPYLSAYTASTNFPTVSAYDTAVSSVDIGLVKFAGVVGSAITTPSPLAAWTKSVPVSIQLVAVDQIGAVTWSLASGALPTGVSLTSGGLLSGTPTSSGSFALTVQVSDSTGFVNSRQYAWTVNPVPVVSSAAPLVWTRDRPCQFPLSSTGGTPPITWSSTGVVPEGLSLGPGGLLSGTPTTPGTSSFVAHATDSLGVEGFATVSVRIVEPPRITTTSLAPWTEGVAYFKTITVVEGTPPYAWTLVGGNFPFANPIGAANGFINAVTKTFGSYAFTLRVTDAAGAYGEGAIAMTLNPSPQIDTEALPPGAVGRPYAAVLHGHDGTAPTTWTAPASFPDGVEFDPATGAFSGTPTAPGVSIQAFTYADSCNAQIVRTFTLAVAAPTDLAKKKFATSVPFDATANSGPRAYFFELLAGTNLGLVVKPKGRRTPLPVVTLRDASGAIVDLAGTETKAGNTYRIKGFVVPVSGRYFVQLAPPLDLSTPTTDTVTVTVAAASSFAGTMALDASKPDVDVVVGVLEGAKATIVVKAARGQKVAPKIVGFFQNGVDLVQPGTVKSKGLTTTLALKTPLAMGEAHLILSAAGTDAGLATWSVKLRQPKTYAFSLADATSGN